MAQGFRVKYRSMDGAIQGERTLTQLPIRLGRNPLNHCQLAQPYISDFHASIELLDGKLCVRDLHSRNGVYSPNGQRLAPNAPFAIGATSNTFVIGRVVHVQVEVLDQARDAFARLSSTRGEVLGNRAALEGVPNPPGAYGGSVPPLPPISMAFPGAPANSPPVRPVNPMSAPPALPPPPSPYGQRREDEGQVNPLPPLSVDASSLARPPLLGVGPVYASSGWTGAGSGAPSGLGGPSSPLGNSALDGSSIGLPALPPLGPGAGFASMNDPVRREPSRHPAARALPHPADAKSTQHFGSMNLESLALAGLRELAGSLTPGSPVESTGDVARLVTKLHDTVEMFCRCFVPLRETYAHFVSSMHLQQAAMQRSLNRSPSALRVEGARDPAALAASLVDFRNHDYDAPAVIEGVFTDLIVHQMALFEGVMRGVQALLAELSPQQIEARAEGGSALFGKHRGLWQAYCDRFEEISRDARTFESIFGGEFAAAYRDYKARSKDSQG